MWENKTAGDSTKPLAPRTTTHTNWDHLQEPAHAMISNDAQHYWVASATVEDGQLLLPPLASSGSTLGRGLLGALRTTLAGSGALGWAWGLQRLVLQGAKRQLDELLQAQDDHAVPLRVLEDVRIVTLLNVHHHTHSLRRVPGLVCLLGLLRSPLVAELVLCSKAGSMRRHLVL